MHRTSHQSVRVHLLGRLPALALLAFALSLQGGCETKKEPPPAPKARSQAVMGKAQPSVSPPARPSEQKTAVEKAPLCDGKLNPAKDLPEVELERQGLSDAPSLSDKLAAPGKWTWVNFWAAWCVPCKEEIPRLVRFQKKLNEAEVPFELAFISLDDDERQLKGFIEEQPKNGLRATYWLKDPDDREKWLDEVGVGKTPDLPAHLILDPKGKLRCIVRGAIDDTDYDEILKLLK